MIIIMMDPVMYQILAAKLMGLGPLKYSHQVKGHSKHINDARKGQGGSKNLYFDIHIDI